MIMSSFLNKFICVTNASTCSSGSKSLSYLSIINIFLPGGSSVSMMSSMKGWSRFSTLWTYWVTNRALSLHAMLTSSVPSRWVRWVPTIETEFMLSSQIFWYYSLRAVFFLWRSSISWAQGMIIRHLTQDLHHDYWAPIFRGSHGRHAKQVCHLP